MKPKAIVSVLQPSVAEQDVALTRALSLAHWYGSHLHVVHVGPSNQASADAIRNQLDQRITLAVDESGTRDVNLTAAALSGNPVRAVADYTGRVGADLVVVGKDVRRSRGYWPAGSLAAALAKAVTSPTIAIPGDAAAPAESGIPFRNILAAIDFSEVSLRALSEALVLAQQSGGRLTLLHVLDGFPYESVYSGSRALRLVNDVRAHIARVDRQLQSLIPADALNWTAIEVKTVYGEAHKAILTTASERSADLVVVGSPRRPRLEQIVAGSTAERVLRRATAAVLLVPGPSAVGLFRPTNEHDGRFALEGGVS